MWAVSGQVHGWPLAPWASRKSNAEPRGCLESSIHGLVCSEHEPRRCSDGLVLEGLGSGPGKKERLLKAVLSKMHMEQQWGSARDEVQGKK